MIEWPSTLPLPYCDHSGNFRNATIYSPAESGAIARRKRFQKSYTELTVEWRLPSSGQLTDFETFFNTTLRLGTSLFSIELRHPKNTALTEWIVRFVDSYSVSIVDGAYLISADLDLIRRALLPAISGVVLFEGFEVADAESSGAGHIPFATSEGNEYHVRE
jgi:hypothetical protein